MNQSLTQLLTQATTALQQNPIARNRRWLLLLLLLPMLACALPGTVPQPPFHPTGQIVFECWPERRNAKVCMVNADGSEKRVITPTRIPMPDGISGNSPVWSPDRKQLAFLKIDKTNNNVIGLFVVNQDGKNEKRLVKGSVFNAVWSPNGGKIAYAIHKIFPDHTSTVYIYIMNSDGSGQIQLINTYMNSLSWSPDGTKIAFTCNGICIMNLDGSDLIQLSDSGMSPSWSPDGQYIAYYKSDPACILCPNSGQLWVMRADGSQPTRITDGPVDQNPAWMPEP